MGAYWQFARRMLRYRATLAWSMLFAVLSAGGLGAGLLGVAPILNSILGQDTGGLPGLARGLNDDLAGWAPGWLRVPGGVIDALPDGRFTAVAWIMGGLGLLTLLGASANFLHQYLSLTVVQRTIAGVRREAFRRVIKAPLKDVVVAGTADPVSRIVQDVATLEGGLTALLSKAVAQTSKGAGAFVAALWFDWRLTLVAVVVAPALAAVIKKLGTRIRRASRRALQHQSLLVGAATEALQGLRVVKVHAAERYESGRFHRINKDVMRELLRARTARALSSPLVEVMTLVALGGLCLVAVKLILDGYLDRGDFILTIAALGVTGASLRPLTGIVNEIQASAGAAARVRELLDTPQEPGHGAGLPRLARHARSIEFRRVTFTYPGAARPSLRDVSLEIRHGERVAFVGPNGSGKTTLLSLVPRLFDPDEPEHAGQPRGGVFIDGRDVREVRVRSLRRQIGVVTQETVLFRGTIRSNIAYGAEGVSDAKVEEAARRARAHEFIARLPMGYETPVGERGLTLSGGQRQRIAIARAVLRDPSILILDEATSMVDAESESQIAEAVREFGGGRTTLVVAHRLSTVVSADRIVVLDDGRVVDVGPHAQLLERCGVYQVLARTQLLAGAGA